MTRQDSSASGDFARIFKHPKSPDSSFKSSFLQRVRVEKKKTPGFPSIFIVGHFCYSYWPPSSTAPPLPHLVPVWPRAGGHQSQSPSFGAADDERKNNIDLYSRNSLHTRSSSSTVCRVCVISSARAPHKRVSDRAREQLAFHARTHATLPTNTGEDRKTESGTLGLLQE